MFRVYETTSYEGDTKIKNLFEVVKELSEEVYSVLGAGFTEEMYQRALQVEFRSRGIRFQREVNIEIFYKGIPLGFDRPDFIIRPFNADGLSLSKPVVIELKAVKKLNDRHKVQATTYLKSLPHSSDEELKSCRHCILINFSEEDGKGVECVLIEREEV